jgi:BlaI family transcriptional regulator, penicillinase repressor
MARPKTAVVTDAEHAILDVLWTQEEASVREVTEALAGRKPVAYTTVLTMLGVLHRKGLVQHRSEGRAFIYRAAVTRAEVRARALGNLLTQLFEGSAEALALHLIENHDLNPKALEQLRSRIRNKATEGETP